MMAGAPLLTLREVATHLRVELRTVQRWAKDGTMPARKIVGHWRVDRGALEAWIGEQECPSTKEAASGGAEFRLPDASIAAAYEQVLNQRLANGSRRGKTP